jgi:Virulence-associated protein E
MSEHKPFPEHDILLNEADVRADEARMFVRTLLQRYGVKLDKDKGLVSTKDIYLGARGDIEEAVVNHIYYTGKVVKDRPRNLWLALINSEIDRMFIQRREGIIQTLLKNPAAVDSSQAVEEFVRVVTGNADPVTSAVIRQFIWQVKRKMLGRPVRWHIMPILWGAGGSGKSTIIRDYLLKPLQHLCLSSSRLFSDLNDERKFYQFNDNYVAFSDEMDHIEKVSMEALKNIISSETLEGRVLYRNSSKIYKQNCTFIATSNKSPSQLIYDSTGIRRFYYIKSVDKMDFEAVARLNIMEMWHSVDEDRDKAYTEDVMDQLNEVQEGHRQKEVIELFLKEIGLKPSLDSKDIIVGDALYQEFKMYKEDSGYTYPIVKNSFFSQLVDKYKFARCGVEIGAKKAQKVHFYASRGVASSQQPAVSADVLFLKGIKA